MKRLLFLVLGLGACSPDPAPVADRRDADIAAASERAIRDTDGAMREAATSATVADPGTN